MRIPFSRFLDTNGDGTGTKNATGNYSASPQSFLIEPLPNQKLEVHSIRMFVKVADIDADEYGSNGALTNGISMLINNSDGVVRDLFDGVVITEIMHWLHFCEFEDFRTLELGLTAQSEYFVAVYNFSKNGGPVLLRDRKGENIEISLNDNFTGLNEHYFCAQGVILGKDV